MKIYSSAKQNGQILVSLVVTMPFLLLMIASYISLSSSNMRLAKQDQLHTHAQLSVDSGADYAIEQINQNPDWTGTNGEVTLHNDGYIRSTYSITVSHNSPISKTIVATGRSYWPANTATPKSSVTVYVDLRPVQSGSYSVVSGEGGLSMSNSSKIAGGDILVNGIINMSNSAQIGLSTNSVNVQVADQACPVPPDASYPRVCGAGEGSQPISMSNTSHIYGSVRANNQSDGSKMSDPGLIASSGVVLQPLPTYDRNAQKSAVSTNMTGGAASCASSQNITWPANTKITGDVSVSSKCHVTVDGDVWITGSLTLSNSSQLIVANSLGGTRPHIMVDGANGVTIKNSAQLISNSSSTGFEMLTFWSSAACSPDCSSVTGVDLYNSHAVTTISLQNSAQGAHTIFYAYWSQVSVGNSGQIGALIGQTIQLQNTGTITFTTSTGVGNTFWVTNGYRRTY